MVYTLIHCIIALLNWGVGWVWIDLPCGLDPDRSLDVEKPWSRMCNFVDHHNGTYFSLCTYCTWCIHHKKLSATAHYHTLTAWVEALEQNQSKDFTGVYEVLVCRSGFYLRETELRAELSFEHRPDGVEEGEGRARPTYNRKDTSTQFPCIVRSSEHHHSFSPAGSTSLISTGGQAVAPWFPEATYWLSSCILSALSAWCHVPQKSLLWCFYQSGSPLSTWWTVVEK